MWTQSKARVEVGDLRAARGIASYLLDGADSPRAFSPAAGEDGGPQPVSYWLGSSDALAKLGLRRGQRVEQEGLELALQGRHVDGSQVRRPGPFQQAVLGQDGKPLRDADDKPVVETKMGVVSYRMTFSAPKSVSIVWSQAGEELKRKIERAMFDAWNTALEHMLRSHDVVMVGRDEDGKAIYGPASGFAAAATLHVTARRAKGEPAPAPQLHVEGALVGTLRDDDALVGIRGMAIFGDAALEAGAYGRAKLAENLSEIGFGIRSSTGNGGLYFEIEGVADELCEAMSGRTQEIEEEVERRQTDGREVGPLERAQLAMFTRMAKEGNASAEEIMAWWRARVAEFEFGPEAVPGLLGEPGYDRDPLEAGEELAALVEAGLRKRGPTVTRAAARALVMAASPGRISFARAEELIGELQASGALLSLDEGRVTSPSIRSEELKVVATVRRVNERRWQPLSAAAVEAGKGYAMARLEEGTSLNKEQEQAIEDLSAGAGWSILSGRAGTGKSPVLQALAEGHRHDGWGVISCAVDWNTANDVARKIGATPLSLRQLLIQAREGDLRVDDRTLILIEEAGKVGLPQWRELAELVEGSGARVLGVGHAGQIGAIELPGMFEEMVRHPEVVRVAKLREPLRHEFKWMRDLQVAIDEGHGDLAVEILEREKAIEFHATRVEAMEAVVDGWYKAQRARGGERAAMIVQGSNDEVDEVSQLAQERRLREKEIGGPSVRAPESKFGFYVGDRVVLRVAAWSFAPDEDGERPPPVQNGTTGVVLDVDPERQVMGVEVDEPGSEPRRVEIDLERAPRERSGTEEEESFGEPVWKLGYAIHPNPAQGMTIESVHHLGGHWSQDQESSYVALSRQIAELRDHVNCENFHGETREEWLEEYVRLLSNSRRRAASIRFGETPKAAIDSNDRAADHSLPEEIDFLADLERPGRRPLAELLDPLGSRRMVLGEERSAAIEAAAGDHAAVASGMSDGVLLDVVAAERDKARAAFERLDVEAALRTLRLEQGRKALEREIQRARAHARTVDEMTAGITGWGPKQRDEREAMKEIAATQRRLASESIEHHRDLVEEENELRRGGAHLDSWVEAESRTIAHFVAAERELFVRNQGRLEDEIEASLHDPSDEIVALVGPVPEAGEPEREEWEEIVWELECNRLILAGELPASPPGPRELRRLERRIEQLREWRESDPELDFDPEFEFENLELE